MKILLDTHAFLWLVTDDPKLSSTAKSIFLDNTNEILLSAVSGFEIAVKYSLGKLELNEEPKIFVENVPVLSKDAIFSNYRELNCIW